MVSKIGPEDLVRTAGTLEHAHRSLRSPLPRGETCRRRRSDARHLDTRINLSCFEGL
jgi:hypothetical protein